MEICRYAHTDIVHNEQRCPLCVAREELKATEDEITMAMDSINSLNYMLANLERRFAAYPEEFRRWSEVKTALKGDKHE